MIGNESKVEVLEMQLDSLKSQVFVLFGLLVLTLGGLTYCLFTLLSETTPDLIQASRIQVVDDDGFPVIDLFRKNYDRHSNGEFRINTTRGSNEVRDGEGTNLICLGADEESKIGLAYGSSSLSGKYIWYLSSDNDGTSGSLELFNSSGDPVFLSVARSNCGTLALRNEHGDNMVDASATPTGGGIQLSNGFNEKVITMHPSAENSGQILLLERSDPSKGRSENGTDNISLTQSLPDKPASGQ